jgi:hypothetical protein
LVEEEVASNWSKRSLTVLIWEFEPFSAGNGNYNVGLELIQNIQKNI